jgi:hypothetical protein
MKSIKFYNMARGRGRIGRRYGSSSRARGSTGYGIGYHGYSPSVHKVEMDIFSNVVLTHARIVNGATTLMGKDTNVAQQLNNFNL